MRWSYEDLCATPVPVVDEVEAWMREQSAEIERQRKAAETKRGR
jgi:hypothetical protein